MTERAGREIDSRERLLRMNAEQSSVSAECIELLLSEPSLQVKRGIEREGGVALRHNEWIALGIRWVTDTKYVAV